MLRFLLGPRWLPWHAAAVVAVAACTWLGLWQLGHYEHHARPVADRPVVALDELARPGGRLTGDDDGRRVTAAGTYDDAHTLLVPGRRQGGRSGLLVLTPLRTSSGVLPVVRGWVAARSADAVTPPVGDVRLAGQLQLSETSEQSAVDPLEPLPAGQIAYVSTVNLLDTWPFPPRQLYDGYVVATREVPSAAASPARVEAQVRSGGVGRWRNLAYALNWWLFGAAAIFFWGSVLRRGLRDQRTDRSPVR